MIGLQSSTVSSYASDIEIYQAARSGQTTLMMLLDISGSMGGKWNTTACDLDHDFSPVGYVLTEQSKDRSFDYIRYYCEAIHKTHKTVRRKYYQRITRLQDAMFDLLEGNKHKGIQRLADHYVIGLATLGVYYNRKALPVGAILVPARRLDQHVNGQTQRQILLAKIAALTASTETPTARSYAETVAYLMGNSTAGVEHSGFSYSVVESKAGDRYLQPDSLQRSNPLSKCGSQGIYVLTDGQPFNDSNSAPLISKALNTSFSCSEQDSFDCLHALALRLAQPTQNPLGLKIKTAVVGFGQEFNHIPSYHKHKTQAANIQALGPINSNVKKAAYWGIIGQGGWYSGLSTQDIVNSVNGFIDQLSTDIPVVTTGAPTIAVDPLNPAILQNDVYYSQFQPTPDHHNQLWLGNLKKYRLDANAVLKDKNGAFITNHLGQLLNNQDLWTEARPSSWQQQGADQSLNYGMKAQLLLRHNSAQQTQRKLLTTRSFSKGKAETSTVLALVKIQDIEDPQKRFDPKLAYLMNALGYAYQPSNQLTLAQLKQQPELRQVGAIMHSKPLFLTNRGRSIHDQRTHLVQTTGREDYIVFGTTQGLLHVVDAITGREKFAFLPNEMVETQAEALASVQWSNGGGKQKLFYGIDGEWTAYTEYVLDKNDDRMLTVGQGRSYTDAQHRSRISRGKQLIYGGLRMGGRNYYALDLSNINQPKLQFQIIPQGQCTTTNPLGCMGQSWSKPNISWIKWQGQKKLVMFVGGGYDAGGDDGNAFVNGVRIPYAGYESAAYQQNNKRGAGVYMFDALTGRLLWWAGANATHRTSEHLATFAAQMKYSVVSEIKTVDRDADGLMDHLYFGDLAGQVWRIDLNNQLDTHTFTAQPELFARPPVRLLDLHTGASSPRFYSMPAFSTYSDNGTVFAVLSLGSGNQSSPLASYMPGQTGYQDDAIFNLYDKDVIRPDLFQLVPASSGTASLKKYAWPNTALKTKNITLADSTTVQDQSLKQQKLWPLNDQNRVSDKVIVAPYLHTQGWYYRFKHHQIQDKKVMASPIVINHDLYVTLFDRSQKSTLDQCGANIQGTSSITLFCMPYGQCKTGSITLHSMPLGAGIIAGAVGNGSSTGMTRMIVSQQDKTKITDNVIMHKHYQTVTKLIPQRWYEQH